jgi:hypothetical protein
MPSVARRLRKKDELTFIVDSLKVSELGAFSLGQPFLLLISPASPATEHKPPHTV